MKNNVKEIKTTIIGIVIWIVTGFYFVTPYFSELELWKPDLYGVVIGIVGGLLLLLAPDRFITFLFGWLNKRK